MMDLAIATAPWTRLAAQAICLWPTGARAELIAFLREQRDHVSLIALAASIEATCPFDVSPWHFERDGARA